MSEIFKKYLFKVPIIPKLELKLCERSTSDVIKQVNSVLYKYSTTTTDVVLETKDRELPSGMQVFSTIISSKTRSRINIACENLIDGSSGGVMLDSILEKVIHGNDNALAQFVKKFCIIVCKILNVANLNKFINSSHVVIANTGALSQRVDNVCSSQGPVFNLDLGEGITYDMANLYTRESVRIVLRPGALTVFDGASRLQWSRGNPEKTFTCSILSSNQYSKINVYDGVFGYEIRYSIYDPFIANFEDDTYHNQTAKEIKKNDFDKINFQI